MTPRDAVHALVLSLALGAAPAGAQIVAPEDADPGVVVAVPFERAPAPGAVLRLRPVATDGSVDETAAPLLEVPVDQGSGLALIEAPADPGSYRLELVEDGRIVSRAELEVAAPAVSLTAPPRLPPAKPFEVAWVGADFPDDSLQLRDAAGRTVARADLPGRRTGQGVAAMTAPDAGGTYLLAYVDGDSGTVLASQPLEVEDRRAWLRSPGTAPAGRPFEVTLFGPTGPDHALRVTEEGGAILSETATEGSIDGRLTVPAPRRAGRYRLRYVNLATGAVLSDVPLVTR